MFILHQRQNFLLTLTLWNCLPAENHTNPESGLFKSHLSHTWFTAAHYVCNCVSPKAHIIIIVAVIIVVIIIIGSTG